MAWRSHQFISEAMATARVPCDWQTACGALPQCGAGLTQPVHVKFVLCKREGLCSQKNGRRKEEKLGVGRS